LGTRRTTHFRNCAYGKNPVEWIDPFVLTPRAESARKAGVREVPVNVNTVAPEAAEKLKDDAAMARAERMNRC